MTNPFSELKEEVNSLGPSWNLFGKVDRMKHLLKEAESTRLPKDWIVYECGQSPVHGLWYACVYNIETGQNAAVEERDTIFEAIYSAFELAIGQDEKPQPQ